MSTQNNPEDLDIRNKPDSGESSRNLINAISTIQSYHVGQMDIRVLFENLLANFLALTESEYGFIGHVLVNEKDQKYLKSLAITNIAWNEETQKLYDENVETGLEFYNLDTLFGRVITTGEPVISNDPSSDPRGSGIPQGHPPLNAFLGLPLYSGDRLIGMVGLANRPQGYNEAVVSNLTPFLTTCSHIILAHLNDQKRQEIEKALRINEERLKLALEGASDGLWDWNVATGEVYFSPRWMTMLGYEPFELEGNVKTWEKLVHPEDMAHVMEVLTQHLEGKTPFYQTEHRVKGKHGHWVWILDRGKVVERDADGKPLRAVGTHADITQLKNIQVQLKGAIEEAERANQAKSEFLSRMSHELRTPLNAILGFGQLLDKDPALSQNQKDNVDKILQGGNHLLTLINEILDLSRIEAGNLKVSLENTSIRQAVNEVIDLLKPLADEMSISLHCQTDFSGLQAWVDRFRFKQILVNLVSNAIKYNKVHGEVSITWTPVSNGKFLLNVMDTGPGIPQDQLDKIFDPFYRSFEHQRRKEGSGIGLSISKQLIQLMNGSIEVHSQPDKGSRFSLTLPTGTSEPSAPSKPLAKSASEPIRSDRSATILYIEDYLDNVEIVQKLFSTWPNVLLSCAFDAETGLHLARKIRPDLILMDIRLPGMDGFEAFEQLRSFEECASIPVVAVSADAMPEQVNRAIEMGFRAYIPKPLDISQILETVTGILGES